MSAATYLNVPDKKNLKENPQMQNQVLYAPFVKAQDKVKRDVADLSLSDFQPKRFALNYDPPMIILEYLVPSTGKLYHHKMKLRRLTGESTVKECIKYLQKRHPLYFINNKIREDQITDLLQKLIYRVKQNDEMKGAKGKPAGIFSEKQSKPAFQAISSKFDKKPSIEQPESQFPPPTFKSGNALPALEDDEDGNQFPGLGGGNKQQDLQKKANAMFDDLDLDDDFEDNSMQESDIDNSAQRKQKLKNEATADLAFEQDSDSGEFNANELMDFSNYNNKRQQPAKQSPFISDKPKAAAGLNINDVLNEQKREQMNQNVEESDDWGQEDDWGEPVAKEIHLKKDEMKNKNLNQLNNEELAAHKRAMDKDFNKHQLKPGDAGFQYDKVVDFTNNKDEGPLEDDSWGEDDEVEENQPEEDEEEYYYDEEEVLDDTQNMQQEQQQQPQRASNLDDEGDDADYFDDDFDDDFA